MLRWGDAAPPERSCWGRSADGLVRGHPGQLVGDEAITLLSALAEKLSAFAGAVLSDHAPLTHSRPNSASFGRCRGSPRMPPTLVRFPANS